jgi:hypothetical protein
MSEDAGLSGSSVDCEPPHPAQSAVRGRKKAALFTDEIPRGIPDLTRFETAVRKTPARGITVTNRTEVKP